MPAPWFKLYSKEILSDPKVKQLDHDQLGKLVLLWAFANEDGCCIPSDPVAIGKLLGVANKNQMVKHLVWVTKFFAPVEGDGTRLVSLRLLAEQNAYEAKCLVLRKNGAKGGRPSKPKAKPDGFANGEPDVKPNTKANETEEGRRKKEKALPPKPPRGGTGRRSRQEILEPFGPEVVRVVNTLLDEWRTEDPEDGRPIKAGPEDTGKAVDGILKAQPHVTPDMLIQAGREYLASTRQRYKAPQYFFGPQGPWDGFVRAQMTTREVAHAS